MRKSCTTLAKRRDAVSFPSCHVLNLLIPFTVAVAFSRKKEELLSSHTEATLASEQERSYSPSVALLHLALAILELMKVTFASSIVGGEIPLPGLSIMK